MTGQGGAGPGLLIFDCDGVLVDSEPLAEQSLRAGIAELGLDLAPQDIRARFRGLSMKSVVETLGVLRGAPVPAGWLERQQERDFAFFALHLEPVPGAEALVETVKARGIPYCVASSGSLDKMRFTLGVTGLLGHFEHVLFSTAMVERGKPYPDLFLLVSERMGVGPEACVVIEDSVNGIKAARAAGMRALAYAGSPTADREGMAAEGGELFEHMEDVPKLLGFS